MFVVDFAKKKINKINYFDVDSVYRILIVKVRIRFEEQFVPRIFHLYVTRVFPYYVTECLLKIVGQMVLKAINKIKIVRNVLN